MHMRATGITLAKLRDRERRFDAHQLCHRFAGRRPLSGEHLRDGQAPVGRGVRAVGAKRAQRGRYRIVEHPRRQHRRSRERVVVVLEWIERGQLQRARCRVISGLPVAAPGLQVGRVDPRQRLIGISLERASVASLRRLQILEQETLNLPVDGHRQRIGRFQRKRLSNTLLRPQCRLPRIVGPA